MSKKLDELKEELEQRRIELGNAQDAVHQLEVAILEEMYPFRAGMIVQWQNLRGVVQFMSPWVCDLYVLTVRQIRKNGTLGQIRRLREWHKPVIVGTWGD